MEVLLSYPNIGNNPSRRHSKLFLLGIDALVIGNFVLSKTGNSHLQKPVGEHASESVQVA
jgi:hypothetical protein